MDYPNPHAEGCFWHQWTEQVGAPNIKWCEPTVCGIISEPANTWSNLVYLALAGICLAVWWRSKNPTLRWFAPAVFLMGCCSFVYHMSNNFVGQLMDLTGVFMWIYLLVAIDLRRFGWLTRSGARAVYWALVLVSSLGVWGLYLLDLPFQTLVIGLAVVLLILEVWLRLRDGAERVTFRWFGIAVGLLGVAAVFSLLDKRRIWCDPDNLFLHGHALWHLFSALGVGAAFIHFRQIRLDDAGD